MENLSKENLNTLKKIHFYDSLDFLLMVIESLSKKSDKQFYVSDVDYHIKRIKKYLSDCR